MTPIQQLMLGTGGAKEKTYLDDVFSTYLYAGNQTARSINNGIDLSGEGGLVWTKRRSATGNGTLYDTARGATYYLRSNLTNAQSDDANTLSSFNNNGFSLGTDNTSNDTGDFASWSFRKAPGFFDIITYTGTGSAHTKAHSLGCVPGCIMIKKTSAGANWRVYHRGVGATKGLKLNGNDAEYTSSGYWNDTLPTSTEFTIGTSGECNDNGATYVAYLFAGGESTAATARSVKFDGSGDYLNTNTSTDYDLGTGDFTLECWIHPKSGSDWIGIADKRTGSDNTFLLYLDNSATNYRKIKFYNSGDQIASGDYDIKDFQWNHVALVRSSGKTRLYVNGIQVGSTYTDTNDYDTTQLHIGAAYDGNQSLDGWISNFRLVKGTAVYTSAFRPPTKPLTSISGTVLLCCNDSSITGSTTGTVDGSGGNPAASTNSPFDDPAAFTFGDSKEAIITCGSYVGNGNANGPEIHLGWEPQWIMLKRANGGLANWRLWDSMRGIATGGNDATLYPDAASAEYSNEKIDLTPTGFKLKGSDNGFNANSSTFTYVCIRRPDGYVGKPVETATDVFAMDTGSGVSGIPNYDSTFPVDFAFKKAVGASDSWYTGARLIQGRKLFLDTIEADSSASYQMFDSNAGWNTDGDSSSYQSWMFKRHAGFDVVTYNGNQVLGRQIPHNLSKVPEMVWIKDRENNQNWAVGHAGLNGGSSPWDYYLLLSENYAAASGTYWDNESNVGTAPTSTHVTIGSSIHINKSDQKYLMMLFASVDGISKVGYYTGNGSNTERTITLGFQPRFIIIKHLDGAQNWEVLDTTRGWGSGNDKRIWLDGNWAQDDGNNIGAPTSNGFTLTTDMSNYNSNYSTYIYYAHA